MKSQKDLIKHFVYLEMTEKNPNIVRAVSDIWNEARETRKSFTPHYTNPTYTSSIWPSKEELDTEDNKKNTPVKKQIPPIGEALEKMRNRQTQPTVTPAKAKL